MLNVFDSLNFLKGLGLPVINSLLINDYESLKKAFNKFDKTVIKANISGHKSDIGGVIINPSLSDAKSLLDRFGSVIVQPLIKGVELIIGLKHDSVFGNIILAGAGGVLVELINDTSIRVCPVSKGEARSMIKELRVYKLLKGFRGYERININPLISLIHELSLTSIKELDINPLIINNDGAFIVDARLSA